MKNRKMFYPFLCVVMVAMMLLTACGAAKDPQTGTTTTAADGSTTAANASEAAPTPAAIDPFAPMPELTKLTTARVHPSFVKYEEGEDENNNWWTKAFKEHLNIELTYPLIAPWWGTELETIIYTAMATGDYPDFIGTYDSIYLKFLNAGKLQDITEVYEKYASPNLKKLLSQENNLWYNFGQKENKLYAVASPANVGGSAPILWIRNDWLKKLNLQPPKNLQELEAVMKAFIENDPDGNEKKDSFAFVFNKDLWNADQAMAHILEMYHIRRGFEVKDGRLENGLLNPAMKDAWRKLNEWYKLGYINKDFATMTQDDSRTPFVAGKAGMMVGAAWSIGGDEIKKSYENDLKAEWIVVPWFSADGQPVKHTIKPKPDGFTFVTDKCKNPEAVIKLLNLTLEITNGDPQPSWVTSYEYNSSEPNHYLSFFYRGFGIGDPNYGVLMRKKAQQALKENADINTLPYEARDYYSKMKLFLEGDRTSDVWMTYVLNREGGFADFADGMQADHVFLSEFKGLSTPTQVAKDLMLDEKLKEYTTRAIMDGSKIDALFDEWVNFWNKQGGAQIMEEVNAWYAEQKK